MRGLWLAQIGNETVGPLTGEDFRRLSAIGYVSSNTPVRRPGTSEWIPAYQIPEYEANESDEIELSDDSTAWIENYSKDMKSWQSPDKFLTASAKPSGLTNQNVGSVVQVYHLFTYVAGIQFPNTDGTSRQEFAKTLRVGQSLELVHDNDNPHDANAIKVLVSRDRQIGFLPRKIAIEVAPLHKRGWKYGCFVTSLGEEWEYDADDNETEQINADVLLVGAGPSATDADAQAYFNAVICHIVAIRYPNFPLIPI